MNRISAGSRDIFFYTGDRTLPSPPKSPTELTWPTRVINLDG